MNNVWREGNDVELLINGEQFFPRVFQAIRNAKREVLLETFIFNEDKVGEALQHALIDAAQRGVSVEVTIDDYGTPNLSTDFIRAMTDAGVKIHVFDPSSRVLGIRVNIFRRLHRKIVVVDAELAFIGGINYSADHLVSFGPTAKQDYAVQVRGPIVQDVHRACWQLLLHGCDKADYKKSKTINRQNKQDTQTNPPPEPVGNTRMLLAVRDNVKHTTDIERHYLRAIRGAKQRLMIANAYFFPGYRFLRAIRRAAQRGVKVTLILQGRPDMPWVTLFTRLLYEYLLRHGVVIHEYCQRPLHGKVALVDDSWTTIGSSNLDPLSLALNLEANLVIDDKVFNQHLFDHLSSLAKSHCKPINIKVMQRSYWWRLPLVFIGFHFLRAFPRMASWLPIHSPKLELLASDTESQSANTETQNPDVEKIS